MALASRATTLHLDATGTAASTTSAGASARDRRRDAPSRSTRSFGRRSPTFIKLDIEGFEPDALMGARTDHRAARADPRRLRVSPAGSSLDDPVDAARVARRLRVLSSTAQRRGMGPRVLCRSASAVDMERAMTAPHAPRGCPICDSVASQRPLPSTVRGGRSGDLGRAATTWSCADAAGAGTPMAFPPRRRSTATTVRCRNTSITSGRRRVASTTSGGLALIADLVAPQLPSPAVSILDVGCATGRLLANLRDRGFANVMGLDPSPACAAAAARLYDIDVLTMTLGDLAGRTGASTW